MHLGKSETVRNKEIVGIFDIEKATESGETKKFLARMQKEYKAVNLCTDLPAAFVLTDGEYTDRVYGQKFNVEDGILKGTVQPETTYIIVK